MYGQRAYYIARIAIIKAIYFSTTTYFNSWLDSIMRDRCHILVSVNKAIVVEKAK